MMPTETVLKLPPWGSGLRPGLQLLKRWSSVWEALRILAVNWDFLLEESGGSERSERVQLLSLYDSTSALSTHHLTSSGWLCCVSLRQSLTSPLQEENSMAAKCTGHLQERKEKTIVRHAKQQAVSLFKQDAVTRPECLRVQVPQDLSLPSIWHEEQK